MGWFHCAIHPEYSTNIEWCLNYERKGERNGVSIQKFTFLLYWVIIKGWRKQREWKKGNSQLNDRGKFPELKIRIYLKNKSPINMIRSIKCRVGPWLKKNILKCSRYDSELILEAIKIKVNQTSHCQSYL